MKRAKMFVANADGCQVMCRWGASEDRTISEKILRQILLSWWFQAGLVY